MLFPVCLGMSQSIWVRIGDETAEQWAVEGADAVEVSTACCRRVGGIPAIGCDASRCHELVHHV